MKPLKCYLGMHDLVLVQFHYGIEKYQCKNCKQYFAKMYIDFDNILEKKWEFSKWTKRHDKHLKDLQYTFQKECERVL